MFVSVYSSNGGVLLSPATYICSPHLELGEAPCASALTQPSWLTERAEVILLCRFQSPVGNIVGVCVYEFSFVVSLTVV